VENQITFSPRLDQISGTKTVSFSAFCEIGKVVNGEMHPVQVTIAPNMVVHVSLVRRAHAMFAVRSQDIIFSSAIGAHRSDFSIPLLDPKPPSHENN
jgi:hypothetical protein